MGTSVPYNDYSVTGTLSVTAASTAAAETAAATALTAIKTALATLANGASFTVPESNLPEGNLPLSESGAESSPAGNVVEFDEPDGSNGVYSVSECQLIAPAVNQGAAQLIAEAAFAAITTAISGLAGTTVTLQNEPQGAEGGFVFNLLQ